MIFKRTICIALVISIIFSFGIFVNADNHRKNHEENFRKIINQLVEEGKLTQEKADKIFEFVNDRIEKYKKMSRSERKQLKTEHKFNLMSDIVVKGIITDDEAQLIKVKLIQIRQEEFNNKLNLLIKNGVITEADSKAIKEYMIKVRDEQKEKLKEIENMSEEERKEFFKQYKWGRKRIFEKMVKDKVITKKQADELKKIFFKR